MGFFSGFANKDNDNFGYIFLPFSLNYNKKKTNFNTKVSRFQNTVQYSVSVPCSIS